MVDSRTTWILGKLAFRIISVGLVFLLLECSKKEDSSYFFKSSSAITEDELYDFLNNVYATRIDSLSSSSERIIFELAGPPIRIPFENGAPTLLEPPGIDFLKATYQLDVNRLSGFKVISSNVYENARNSMIKNDCSQFDEQIGSYMVFIHLPWYNPKDSSLLIKEVYSVCPPYYHQSAGVLFRFKKRDQKWELTFE